MNFEKIAEQVPALAVLVFVVVVFLRSQGKRDEAFLGFIEQQNERFKNLGDACHVVQEKATTAIAENTKMYGRLEKALEQTTEKIQAIGVERRREEPLRR